MHQFRLPPPGKTATELLADVPPDIGEEREDHLLQLFTEGQFPVWLRMWQEVNVEDRDGNQGTFYVMPDFLCFGTDDDYCYAPMGGMNAERVLSLFDAVLPTPKMVADIYNESTSQIAVTWGPPYDGSMMRTERWPIQTQRIREAMKETGARPGDLVEGHMKNVTVSEKMVANKGVDLSFWGWFDEDGKPIQGDSLAHGAGYCDYAHGVRGVLRTVAVNNALMTLAEALEQPEFCALFTRNGPFSPSSYRETRAHYGITKIKY